MAPSPQPPSPRPPSPPTDRLLGLCPPLVGVLWVGGVASFRDVRLTPMQWMTITAAAFALHLIANRLWRRRPLPALPENARAMRLAALVATIFAVIAFVVGGALELVANRFYPTDVAWGLRTLWHAACAFGASYCLFLRRLLRVLPA